jgi:hypothetical protein
LFLAAVATSAAIAARNKSPAGVKEFLFMYAIFNYQKPLIMKRKLLILSVVLFAMTKGHAQTCQSLFANAEKIFNGLAQDYIAFRMEAAEAFVNYIIPQKPKADQKLDELFDKATKLQLDLYKSFGVMTGESNQTVGAVKLIIPLKKWTGTLFTERTFTILQSPFDKVVIKVKKTDGKRGVKFRACAKYANGSPFDDKAREIDNGNETAGVEKMITFEKDMMDKNITLHLVAFGNLPTDKCEYVLTIEGYFDEEEMKKIDEKNKKAKKENPEPKKIESGAKLDVKPAIKQN